MYHPPRSPRVPGIPFIHRRQQSSGLGPAQAIYQPVTGWPPSDTDTSSRVQGSQSRLEADLIYKEAWGVDQLKASGRLFTVRYRNRHQGSSSSSLPTVSDTELKARPGNGETTQQPTGTQYINRYRTLLSSSPLSGFATHISQESSDKLTST